MISGLSSLLSSEKKISKDVFLKISQDYIREVVAHEVGHTLGLRHNFAGSLHSNLDLSKKEDVFLDYAKKGKLHQI